MSGGSYDYFYGRVAEVAHQIREEAGCRSPGTSYPGGSSPALRRAFRAHLLKVSEALRAIEWNDSGDGDDREEGLIRELLGPTAEVESALVRARESLAELSAAIEVADARASGDRKAKP